MSEAELHLLKNRMDEGRRAKARRGELFRTLPCGYVRRPSGEIALDPDEQVQATVRLIFDLFERHRSIDGVLAWCVAHDVRLPYRIRSGPAQGELEWHRPNRYRLGRMLRNPTYAGAYTYGRRRAAAPSDGSAGGDGWEVLLKDHWPSYITRHRYPYCFPPYRFPPTAEDGAMSSLAGRSCRCHSHWPRPREVRNAM